jgi:hypothetical protein
MDVNYYLHREQIERMRADSAATRAAGQAHRDLADLYRARIAAYRAQPAPPIENRIPAR